MEIKVQVAKLGYNILLGKSKEIATYQKEMFEKLFLSLEVSYRNDTDQDIALVFTAKLHTQLIIDKELEDWHTLTAEEIKDRIESIYNKVKKWYYEIPASKVVFDLPIIE